MSKKRGASCWHVVSFYAGDLSRVGRRGDKPTGFVHGTHDKAFAIREATHLEKKLGEHVFVRAYSCARAPKLFNLKV